MSSTWQPFANSSRTLEYIIRSLPHLQVYNWNIQVSSTRALVQNEYCPEYEVEEGIIVFQFRADAWGPFFLTRLDRLSGPPTRLFMRTRVSFPRIMGGGG